MTFKNFMIFISICMISIGLIGCSETSKNQKHNQDNIIKKDKSTSYKEDIIMFEADRAYGSFEMKSNDNGNVEYIALEQEQLTDKPISQSYSHEFTGDEWKSEKTKWGGLLKDQLEKQVDLKKRIYETSLSIAADGKIYVTYNFFHPDIILDTKGCNYEYIVSNLLFCINPESNEVVQIKIPDASKCNSNDGINPLKCSAFADGKLLIQDGERTYVYNHITGETVCSVETLQNASNYIPGDDFLYSVQTESNGKFNICEYNENNGKVNRKIPLKLLDAETMQNIKKYKLKVYEDNLYLVCKEGIYRISEGETEFEKIVDGIKDNLYKMTNEEDYIYDFAILENNTFAVDYRKLGDDKKDFNTYESETLVIYNRTEDIDEGTK